MRHLGIQRFRITSIGHVCLWSVGIAYIPNCEELMGQKWGNSYANPCQSMPVMRLCMLDESATNPSKDGRFASFTINNRAQLAGA
jgi:hypothetical protein